MYIRPATATDQPAIRAIIRITGINPMRLDWPRFLVAEQDGQVIGVGQVKPHGDGSRELASIAVRPEYQGMGIGTAIVQALLARETGVIYLFCLSERVSFYQRLGFAVAERSELPPVLARTHRIGNWIGYLPRLLGRGRVQLVAMKIVAVN
jgi:N-acetylglutamate synthase-like GNAT family acetyltransferase